MDFSKTRGQFTTAEVAYNDAVDAEKQAAAELQTAEKQLEITEGELTEEKRLKDESIQQRDQVEQDILKAEADAADLENHEERAILQAKIVKLQAEYDQLSEEIRDHQDKIETLKPERAQKNAAVTAAQTKLTQASEQTAHACHGLVAVYEDLKRAITGVIHTEPLPQGKTELTKIERVAARASGHVMVGTSARDDVSVMEAKTFIVRSEEFEHRVNNLLDYLDARRIAEEMDTQTYLLKLQAFFDQAGEHAGTVSNKVLPKITSQVAQARQETQELHDKISSVLNDTPSRISVEANQAVLDRNATELAAINAQLAKIDATQHAAQEQFEAFQGAICDPKSVKVIKDTASKVSSKIEKGTPVMGWPIVTGILAVILLKLALNTFPLPILVERSSWLFVGAFAFATWMSIRLGKKNRASVMTTTRTELQTAIADVFGLDLSKDERFALDALGLNHASVSRDPAKPSDNRLEGRGWMIVRNLATAIVPAACIAFPGVIADYGFRAETDPYQYETQRVFAGAGLNGETCALATGLLVHASSEFYFVVKDPTDRGRFERFVFPTRHASTITRDKVIAVFPVDGPMPLEDCNVQVPVTRVANTYVLPQSGCSFDEGCSMRLDSASLTALTEAMKQVTISTIVDGADMTWVDNFKSDQLAILEKAAQQSTASIEMYITHQPVATPPEAGSNPAMFMYSLQLGEERVIDGVQDKLLMFFNPNVRDIFAKPAEAYDAGLDAFDDQSNSAYEAAGKFYLEELGRMLAQRLDSQGTRIVISVDGFATDKWENVGSDEMLEDVAPEVRLKTVLNLALADGRRAAVLTKLRESLRDSDLTNLLVYDRDLRSCTTLANWRSENKWKFNSETQHPAYSELWSEMVRQRNTAVARVGIDSETDSSRALLDLFERSAFVSILDPSEYCNRG